MYGIGELLARHWAYAVDGSGWPRAESFTSPMEQDGVFQPDYRALIVDYSDRFFPGMDVAHQSRWSMRQGNTFEVRVARTRQLLAQLPPAVASGLAHANAIRIFGLPVSEAALR